MENRVQGPNLSAARILGQSDVSGPDLSRARISNRAKPSVTDNVIKAAGKAVEFVREAAGDAVDAYSGAGARIEYPDLPEMGEAEIGFFESFIPNLKLGLTPDPVEKAKIIQDHFKDDPRLGGVFEDKHGLPMVRWGGKDFYVNKPGATAQDGNDLVAQAVQLFPAGKFAAGAKTLFGKAARAYPAYAASDVAQQYATVEAGGQDTVSLSDASDTGLAGAAVEVALPVIGGAIKKVAAPVVRAIGEKLETVFPRYQPIEPTPSRFPLTQGQRSGDENLLRLEDTIRHSEGSYGEAATGTLRRFDEKQMAEIAEQAGTIQKDMGTGSGFDAEAMVNTGERLQADLIEEAANRKTAGKAATEAARETSRASPALLSREGVSMVADRLAAVPDDMGIATFELQHMPILSARLKQLRKFKRLVKNPRFKTQNFTQLEGYRKSLGHSIKTAEKGTTEHAALSKMKTALDGAIDDAITQGLFSGDQMTIAAIKKSRTVWRDYYRLVGGDKKDPSSKLMSRILDEGQATPEQTIRAFFGVSQIQSTAAARNLVRRVVGEFGAESEQIGLLKDAFLYRTFVNAGKGKSDLTREVITRNFIENFRKRGKFLARELFTFEEIKRIARFAKDVAPTLPAETRLNPSGSGYTLLSVLKNRNMLSIIGRAIEAVPVIGNTTGKTISEVGGVLTARDLVSQAERYLSMPLLSVAGVGALGVANSDDNNQPQTLAERPQQTPASLQSAMANGLPDKEM